MERWEKLLDWGGMRRDIVFLALSGTALLLSLLGVRLFFWDMAWVAILLCGLPIVLGAVHGLITAFDIKADVLVSLALLASVIVGEDFAAGEIAFIMQLGALLEEATVAKARAGIEKLVQLTPRTARRLSAEGEAVIAAEEVAVGDILRVLPGEAIPVDGTILSGQTAVNQAAMTGESIPVDKGPGDAVASGAVNQFGAFEMRAEKVGEDSSIQRMIRLVQSADAGKARIVSLADRWATWIVVIALAAALLTYLVTQEILRSVTILVVFCPCALVLATPTAIMAAIGNATKHGFLVREGDALERLADTRKVAFDKTGTLTLGVPSVVQAKSILPELSDAQLYRYAASAELRSEHPLGKAVLRGFRERQDAAPWEPEAFRMLPGRGVAARIHGREVLAGSLALLEEHSVANRAELAALAAPELACGRTLIFLAMDGRAAGFLALEDTLRESAPETIRRLKAAGAVPALLTGDQEQAARSIARQAGIQSVRPACLPEDKLACIAASQRAGEPVCMVGDGINDAPALKQAHVGIAMGGIGSDIAIEAADIALVNDDISELPHLVRLSRRMMRTIRWNLAFSLLLNLVAILLAMAGILTPVVGALVHNAGSVFVILNSALLLRWGEPAASVPRPADCAARPAA